MEYSIVIREFLNGHTYASDHAASTVQRLLTSNYKGLTMHVHRLGEGMGSVGTQC